MDIARCLSDYARQHLSMQDIGLDAFIVPHTDSAVSTTITKYFAEHHPNESPTIRNSVRYLRRLLIQAFTPFYLGHILYREGPGGARKQAALHLFRRE